jgi:hypothetical protein
VEAPNPEQHAPGDVSMPRGHRAPFQRRLSRIAKVAMAAVLNDQSVDFRVAMDEDLVLGMFALAVTAVILVAGELYLVTRPGQPETYAPPASIVTSSIQ